MLFEMESVKDQKRRAADHFVKVVGLRSCECGPKRRPRRVLRGSLSFLVCDECGGRTTALKDQAV